MRLALLLMLSVLGVTSCAFADDNSQLSAHLASYNSDGGLSVNENVVMIVKDPLGREAGYNPFTKEWKNEIPDANAVSESSDDDDGQKGPADFTIHIPYGLLTGEYSIFVYGLTEARFVLEMNGSNSSGKEGQSKVENYVSSGTASVYTFKFDPFDENMDLSVIKNVNFNALKDDLLTAEKIVHVGEAKFVFSLKEDLNLAEKLKGICDRRKTLKIKSCQPALAVLRLFIKRLELANRKCDSVGGCDEGPELAAFEKAHRGDRDYDDFFREWDKDDWHKWKKTSKRFVTDEALSIIRGDAEVLIKTLEFSPKDPGKH